MPHNTMNYNKVTIERDNSKVWWRDNVCNR